MSNPGSGVLVLLRHGRSTANTAGILAGRSNGIELDDKGRAQSAAVAKRLTELGIKKLVSSPLTRCLQTLEPVSTALGLPVTVEADLTEVDYGTWTGRSLPDLAGEDLWRIVQSTPSAAVFPEGEGLAQVSARAVSAVRKHLASADGPVLVCTHGDVIKAILADALGMHLDGFQRIVVGTASISIVRYTAGRPFVERINDTDELPSFVGAAAAAEPPGSSPDDATVGGSVR